MSRLLVLGAGKIGACISHLLAASGDYAVTVADCDTSVLAQMAHTDTVQALPLEVADSQAVRAAMAGCDTVISALPYYLNPTVAEAACAAGVHYFDLTEDVATTRHVRAIAATARSVFMPQCGLAPGFVSVVAYDLARRFSRLRDIHMRVGALPLYPDNALKYNLTWSTDGLINEYCNLCEAIYEGHRREVLPLEGLEHFSMDGVHYEAFNTSGGLGTLCDTLAGQVETLNYKTVRYPGHRDLVKFLAKDLRLSQRRALFKDVLEHAVPITRQDVVLVFVSVSGWSGERLVQDSFARKIYHTTINGQLWSAIQMTTAASVCVMVDLLHNGKLPAHGFLRQEDVTLTDFLANRFGSHYA